MSDAADEEASSGVVYPEVSDRAALCLASAERGDHRDCETTAFVPNRRPAIPLGSHRTTRSVGRVGALIRWNRRLAAAIENDGSVKW